MLPLLAASLIWAFSFGLIQHVLIGVGVGPFLVAEARLVLSALLFLPFLRLKGLGAAAAGKLASLGAVQYGAMYALYLWSFQYLPSHQVALFTIFTPLYVALFFQGSLKRRQRGTVFLAAALATAGAGCIALSSADLGGTLKGFLLVQGSNLAFAFGQVRYRMLLRERPSLRDRDVFGLLYLGGAAAALPLALLEGGSLSGLEAGQVLTLLYLGLVPSGICFFLWNFGARRAKPGTVAAMNNAKIPLAVLVSLAIFGESFQIWRLLAGSAALVAAVLITEKFPRRA